MKHHIGIEFPSVPFLWYYNDFALPFPVIKSKQTTHDEIQSYVDKYGSVLLKNIINKTTDDDTEFYIIAQQRQASEMYNQNTDFDEIYLSFHTWLHKNDKNTDEITYVEKYSKTYQFMTAIYSLIGTIYESSDYPEIVIKNKNKTVTIPGGIPINKRFELRKARIHDVGGIVRFSGARCCNFQIDDHTVVFISIMRFPTTVPHNEPVNEKKNTVVTLHIFQNNTNDFSDIINQFFV